MELTLRDLMRFQTFYTRMKGPCFLWQGSRNEKGYGTFRLNDKSIKAHRVAYHIAFGQFNEILDVLHTCDCPPCVNPAHLFLGTHQQNMEDRNKKGRQAILYSDETCEEVKRLYSTGEYYQRQIADMFGMTQSNVSFLVTGKTR